VIGRSIEDKTNVEIAVLMKVRAQTIKGRVSALFNKTGSETGVRRQNVTGCQKMPPDPHFPQVR
jgi:hypothetical protein